MAKRSAAQAYLHARQTLAHRLGEIEAEVAEIKAALGLSTTRPPSPRLPKRTAAKRVGASARKKRTRGTGLLAILRHLNEKGPVKPAALAQATGITYGTVSNTLNTLRQRKHVSRSETGWSLTAAGKADLAKRAKLPS